MNKDKIFIFDTTLRDGAQTEGVDFTVNDKIKIAKNELDFAQKSTLNRDFWQNKKLNPKVGKVILTIVKNYLKSTNLRLSIESKVFLIALFK